MRNNHLYDAGQKVGKQLLLMINLKFCEVFHTVR